jgi:hypothetical protein
MYVMIRENILEYCRIHAAKCDDEGLHVRRIVLDTAAQEIIILRKIIERLKEKIGSRYDDTLTDRDFQF